MRCLLFNAGFPASFWGFALHCANFLYNRTPHASLNFITPVEKMFNQRLNLQYIHIFGSRAYVLDPTVFKRCKLQPRLKVMYLVGFTDTEYELFEPETKKTV